MGLWAWQKGRQGDDVVGAGYRKMLLYQLFGRFDGWLIDYDPGYEMPVHKDEVDHGRHFRLNIVLSGQGDFGCKNVILNLWDRVILFRPDEEEHSVSVSKNGNRIVLSLGAVLPKRK